MQMAGEEEGDSGTLRKEHDKEREEGIIQRESYLRKQAP